LRRQALDPSKHRFDTGEKFAGIEWLAHVVIGTYFQPDNSVGLLSHRSQQDNRKVRGAAQMAAEGQSVLARHHDVKNHQVQSTSFEQAAECNSALRKADAVAMLHQVFADQIANIAMIVHDGDVRCRVHLVCSVPDHTEVLHPTHRKSVTECIGRA